MTYRNVKRVGCLLALLFTGIWLIFQASSPQPESIARQQVVRQALAPGGRFAATAGNVQPLPEVIVHAPVAPVTVDLAQIPPGVYDPSNQYDRWLRGEVDLDEMDSIRSAAEIAALQAAALRAETSQQIQQIDSGLGALALTKGVNFDSIDFTGCCGGSGGMVPPDPELAVGPDHIIAVVNVAFAIYDKQGNTLRPPTTFTSFMSGTVCGSGVFDPNVLYDEAADRFILAIDRANNALTQSTFCVAVSATADPMDNWHIYEFNTLVNGHWMDYPHTGVGRDAIYMGGNMFTPTAFMEGRVWAFDKAAMYAGGMADSVSRSLGFDHDTPQPLKLHGYRQGTWPGSGPHYFFAETNFNGRDHTVFAWTDPFGANTFTTVGGINLNTASGVTAGMPVNVPQAGGSTFQANDFRPLDFEFRNGYAWTTMTISCNPGGGTVNCVRWAQIDPATATVVQAGVFAGSGQHRVFPDLAVNRCDDMAVGYTKSSSSMFPSIWYAGRESSDPPGTLQAEAELKAGEITYTAFDSAPRRWGDYTGMTIDPDGTRFWYLGQYSKYTGTSNGRWGTYIGSFTFPGCSLNIHRTISPQVALPGEPITFTLSYGNAGDHVATGVVITDVIPSIVTDLSFTSSGAAVTPISGDNYSWSVADLLPGQGGTITVTGQVRSDLTADATVTSTALITGMLSGKQNQHSDSATLSVTAPRVGFSDTPSDFIISSNDAIVSVGLNTANPYAAVTVNYDTSDGTAVAGVDYTAVNGTVTIPAGTTSASFAVPLLDIEASKGKTIVVTLSNPGGAALGAVSSTIVTIGGSDSVVYLPLITYEP